MQHVRKAKDRIKPHWGKERNKKTIQMTWKAIQSKTETLWLVVEFPMFHSWIIAVKENVNSATFNKSGLQYV